ncbi:MAG: GNAT family N-acetyltransferase [Candidatus Marinimicrobia bacterium]|jgi:acyl-CoA hydrolase/RimJ/RimL family protein N-acetyltransferase|nr:GNAT family N-acetyltransferase [Candidatus Neomarinimicrobiota bacterium]MBT3576660.1 GNAT family N-acetyltransferase [Candidatus Neomarinimicrobiota bacterium]MBT3678916.1 GNAT family N-acetyltransferase [Candidatus Neomarinimicrobiota bacterium]MBT3952251.1 GNAT family N-acetyltransferase [Candidatus Neomarinimicrobiota bacterium]MBT4252912.1 GNAT family N-acetyltransferase [Candidatus Neomarinimicrobiota bacterium]
MANESPSKKALAVLKEQYADKFVSVNQAIRSIHRGDRIFVHTACGEPQYLLRSLVEYIESEPKAVFDAEVLQVWSLGLAPYTQEKYKHNFRHNSFFIGSSTRTAVNSGLADYTPIFLSEIPKLFQRGHVPVDVALIQTSCPDPHGYMSLGVSVDIVKAATEKAQTIIVQVNPRMPRVHGDGFIHISDVDYVIYHEEPLLEYEDELDDDVADKIGKYVATLIEDGNTIQVGYGSLPNAILANLGEKKHLGVHTELLGDGLVKLMKSGVVDNSVKSINRGKTIATFSMGSAETYDYLHDNPFIEFKTVDYTNDPRVIAQHDDMTAINSALEIDLTGQATAESLGKVFYSGIGGQADFMRGAILAKKGKTILTMPSTAENGEVSRIATFLKAGAGVTLNRGDVHYVVTEYGIAYLHGKNIRERAMELISIAHPKFRAELIRKAKKRNLIYQDQAFIAGKAGEYPEKVETYRTTSSGVEVFIRPVKISDEPLLKDFFYSLSDASLQRRFISERKDMPHERLQDFVVIDYTSEIILLAFTQKDGAEQLVGIGQYAIIGSTHTADVAFVIGDDHQELGIGKELLKYLTLLAKKQGLLGFTADVIISNARMMRLFESMGFDVQKHISDGMYEMKMTFLESK